MGNADKTYLNNSEDNKIRYHFSLWQWRLWTAFTFKACVRFINADLAIYWCMYNRFYSWLQFLSDCPILCGYIHKMEKWQTCEVLLKTITVWITDEIEFYNTKNMVFEISCPQENCKTLENQDRIGRRVITMKQL